MVTGLKAIVLSMSILLTGAQALAGAPICTSQDVIDPFVLGRAFSVTFPDGREVTILGRNHGSRDIPSRVFGLVRDEKKPLAKKELLRQFEQIVFEDGDFVEHATADYNFLKDFLKHRPDIQLIGVEALANEWDGIRSDSKNLDAVVRMTMAKTGIRITPEIERSLRAVAGVPLALEFREGEILKGREIRGMETEAGIRGEAEAYQDSSAKRETLKRLLANEAALLPKVDATRGELVQNFGTYQVSTHDAKIVEAVRTALPLKYQEAGLAWIRAELRLLAIRKNRDIEVSRNLAQARQSVVHLVGVNHTESLVNQLVEICKSEVKDVTSARASTKTVPRVRR